MKKILSILGAFALALTGGSEVYACTNGNVGYDLAKFDNTAINDLNVEANPLIDVKSYEQTVFNDLSNKIVNVLQKCADETIKVGDLSITIISWPKNFSKYDNAINYEIDAMPESFHFKNFFIGSVHVFSVNRQSSIANFHYDWSGEYAWKGIGQYDTLMNYLNVNVLTRSAVKKYVDALNLYLVPDFLSNNNLLQSKTDVDWYYVYKNRDEIFTWYYVDFSGVEHLLASRSLINLAMTTSGTFSLHINGTRIASQSFPDRVLSGFAVSNFQCYDDLASLMVNDSQKHIFVRAQKTQKNLYNEIVKTIEDKYLPMLIQRFFGGDNRPSAINQLTFTFYANSSSDAEKNILQPSDLTIALQETNNIDVKISPLVDKTKKSIFINEYTIVDMSVTNTNVDIGDVDIRSENLNDTLLDNMNVASMTDAFKLSKTVKKVVAIIKQKIPMISVADVRYDLMINFKGQNEQEISFVTSQSVLDDLVINHKKSIYDGATFYWRLWTTQTSGFLDSPNFNLLDLNLKSINIPVPSTLNDLTNNDNLVNVLAKMHSAKSIELYQKELVAFWADYYAQYRIDQNIFASIIQSWSVQSPIIIGLYADAAYTKMMNQAIYENSRVVYVKISFSKSNNETLNQLKLAMKIYIK